MLFYPAWTNGDVQAKELRELVPHILGRVNHLWTIDVPIQKNDSSYNICKVVARVTLF